MEQRHCEEEFKHIQNPKCMTFNELESIGMGLFGHSWKAQLAESLNVDRRNITNWEKQGVAKWVYAELKAIIQMRKTQLLAAEQLYDSI